MYNYTFLIVPDAILVIYKKTAMFHDRFHSISNLLLILNSLFFLTRNLSPYREFCIVLIIQNCLIKPKPSFIEKRRRNAFFDFVIKKGTVSPLIINSFEQSLLSAYEFITHAYLHHVLFYNFIKIMKEFV